MFVNYIFIRHLQNFLFRPENVQKETNNNKSQYRGFMNLRTISLHEIVKVVDEILTIKLTVTSS